MLLALLLAAAVAAAPSLNISNLREIRLHDGVNPIDHLGPNGRSGVIVSTYHNNSPGADGASRDYLVVLDSRFGSETVGAKPIPSLISQLPFGGDLLEAAPHTGEDWKRVIRFARGRVDGQPATLMILAERDMRKADTAYEAERVRITYFRLQRDPDFDFDQFVPLGELWSARCYVDANLALTDEIGMPLPSDDAGPKSSLSCSSRRG